MNRQSWDVLERLRSIGTATAMAGLAEAANQRARAAALTAATEQALQAEASEHSPVTYGTWLAAQLAERQRARADEAAAAKREDHARQALVEARREERIVERLVEIREEQRVRRTRQREAAFLDEVGSRRR